MLAQQPEEERIVDVSGSVEGAIDAQIKTFKEGGRPEVLRLSDVLLYPYGIYQPVLTCTVLRACIIELQAGETLISLVAGDDTRWLIDHITTGPGGTTSLVTVKPTDHDITTNLVVSTNRRIYHITLDSPPRKSPQSKYNPLALYTRHIRFYYPADGVQEIVAKEDLLAERESNIVQGPGPADFNFEYAWEKHAGFPWEPLAVFDDGQRVYIKIPQESHTQDQPLLTIERGGEEIVANYVVRNGFYVVDRLFDRARLVLSSRERRGIFRKKRHVQQELQVFPLSR